VGEVRDMDEDGPNDSPYEMLEKHDQSETKRDTIATVSNGSASGCGKMGVRGAFLAYVLTLFR
jgi:hypothetical protein